MARPTKGGEIFILLVSRRRAARGGARQRPGQSAESSRRNITRTISHVDMMILDFVYEEDLERGK